MYHWRLQCLAPRDLLDVFFHETNIFGPRAFSTRLRGTSKNADERSSGRVAWGLKRDILRFGWCKKQQPAAGGLGRWAKHP